MTIYYIFQPGTIVTSAIRGCVKLPVAAAGRATFFDNLKRFIMVLFIMPTHLQAPRLGRLQVGILNYVQGYPSFYSKLF